MRISIMQPYLFPYIGYFQLINASNKFVIHDDVQYIKGGWINRNRILLNGKDFMFTLSLKSDSAYKEINKREFASNLIDREQKNFYRQIETAYHKAPFFEQVFDVIRSTYISEILNVSEAVANSIKAVCSYLNINTEIIFSSQIQKNNDLKGQERVLNICQLLKSTQYINPIGGTMLYSKDTFISNGIKLNFIKTKPIMYKQLNNEFIPALSIIDVMMFNSKEQIKVLLNDFELI